MSLPPDGRAIQRWYPEKWIEIAANSYVKNALYSLPGSSNILVTGPNGTGKTRAISLGIKAALCPNRSKEYDPCGSCASCKMVNEARFPQIGLYALAANSRCSFVPIDCELLTKEDINNLMKEFRVEDDETIVYLDNIDGLQRNGLERLLLKPLDECKCTWIGSSVSVLSSKRKGAQQPQGLSADLRRRFPIKVGSTLPRSAEMTTWIKDRCIAWEIEVIDEAKTIPAAVTRTGHRCGYMIHLLAAAAARGRRLDYPLVSGFDFDALD